MAQNTLETTFDTRGRATDERPKCDLPIRDTTSFLTRFFLRLRPQPHVDVEGVLRSYPPGQDGEADQHVMLGATLTF
ncbi:hypothetical protein PAAG_01274 [Paracoccidioides lutzii Pb01]|uniref:Uncharacterized protein n=1 Tax=Paracoccidioides lutzii (strain ATCC MYA-826 / Pb01) TaxID=502779 RepID=C1GRX9_PARBA|nr:hypothetical protein PAAG_01274 [Paracoccidioides lutzii Pb01]EEH38353.2 hypothetical protein PAAG_01274 [Paracoccidioides lutzii Pb01]